MQIFWVLFMFTFVLAGWLAWRRSPRYSLRATLLVGGATLVVAGTIGGVPAFVAHRGDITTLGGLLLLVFLITGTLALCAFIVRITDGPMEKVPSTLDGVQVHRRKFYRIAAQVSIGLLLAGACDLIPPVRPLGSMLAGLLALCAAPLLWGLHHNAVRDDRGISALMANSWVHWRFTPDEWETIADLVRNEAEKPGLQLKKKWGVRLTFAGLGALTAWLSGAGAAAISGVFVFCILFPFGVNWLVSISAQKQYRRWMAAPRHAWFGPAGLLIGDEYLPWSLSGIYLLSATVQKGAPARAVLRFYIFSGRGTELDKQIPLRAGWDADLRLLQVQLRAVCPNAQVHLASP